MDNEETRLREELAEARRHAREYRELYEEAEPSLRARATAAESALAEARELIDAARAFRAQREVTASDPNKPGAKSDYEQAALRLKSAASRLFPAALARAGEQEAAGCAEGEKAVQGEPASSGQGVEHGGVLDRGNADPRDGDCVSVGVAPQQVATPPPGEQGNGADALTLANHKIARVLHILTDEWEEPDHPLLEKAVQVLLYGDEQPPEQGKGGLVVCDLWPQTAHERHWHYFSGDCKNPRLAPAQSAEHPAPSQLSDEATALLTKENGGTPVYVWRDGSCHPTAEHPASGGEEKASLRVDFQCDTCGHRHVGRLGGICIGCPCERILPTPAPGAGEQEEGT